jgi:hypothetical protein
MNKKLTNKTKIKQRIESLERQSQVEQSELEIELMKTKKSVTDLGKIALGVGAGLVFSALVLRGLTGKGGGKSNPKGKQRSKRVYQRFMSQVFSELSFQSTKFLLNIAKDMLKPHTIKEENAEEDNSEITD